MIEIIPNWHPIFVHFTVALLSAAVGFFLLATIFTGHRWREQWLNVAYWNLWAGGAASILTVAAGWYAFNTVTHDTPSHDAMTEHRNLALVTLAVLLPVVIWSVRNYTRQQRVSTMFLGTMLLIAGLLLSTAWHGAELVYRHGLGVMSLPKPETGADGHGHSHGQAAGAAESGSPADSPHHDAGQTGSMDMKMTGDDATATHDDDHDHDAMDPGDMETMDEPAVTDHDDDHAH